MKKQRMKAAIIYGKGDLRIGEAPKPSPARGEALIQIVACGICPSDLRVYTGVRDPPASPRVAGHEWAGEVVERGEARDLEVGDRVVADWRVICAKCHYCRKGIFNYCENLERGRVTGGFCEYGQAPESNLRKIPDDVSYEEATFTEPLACCVNAWRRTNINPGDEVVVVGLGQIGLMHVQLAKRRGGRVVASDPLRERLEKAREVGADDVIDPNDSDPVEQVKRLTGGRGADAVVVAVGSETAIRQGIDMAGIGGTVNLFAGTYPQVEIPLNPNQIHYKQLIVTGSHDFTPHDFTTALKLIQHRVVAVEPLISHVLPLEEIERGFRIVEQRRGLKVVIQTRRLLI